MEQAFFSAKPVSLRISLRSAGENRHATCLSSKKRRWLTVFSSTTCVISQHPFSFISDDRSVPDLCGNAFPKSLINRRLSPPSAGDSWNTPFYLQPRIARIRSSFRRVCFSFEANILRVQQRQESKCKEQCQTDSHSKTSDHDPD